MKSRPAKIQFFLEVNHYSGGVLDCAPELTYYRYYYRLYRHTAFDFTPTGKIAPYRGGVAQSSNSQDFSSTFEPIPDSALITEALPVNLGI